jgi:hypothetical protein
MTYEQALQRLTERLPVGTVLRLETEALAGYGGARYFVQVLPPTYDFIEAAGTCWADTVGAVLDRWASAAQEWEDSMQAWAAEAVNFPVAKAEWTVPDGGAKPIEDIIAARELTRRRLAAKYGPGWYSISPAQAVVALAPLPSEEVAECYAGARTFAHKTPDSRRGVIPGFDAKPTTPFSEP